MPGSTPVSRRTLLGGALAGGLGLAGVAAGAASAHAAGLPRGVRVVSQVREGRWVTLRLASDALRAPATVRVLLPVGYDERRMRHYPVLYLLHGTGDDAYAWQNKGRVQSIIGNAEVIVVTPDGGRGGWYTSHDHVSTGTVDWERFHVGHVVPTVDALFRTLPWTIGRGIAGFSMGGYGAAIYGARHQWTFGSVTTFSGATDAFDMNWRRLMYSAPTTDGENAGAVYGSQPGHEQTADLRRRDPSTYAKGFVGRRVRLYAGNDNGYEASLRASTQRFHAALRSAGVKDLGLTILPGAHTWDTADAALRRDLPGMLASLNNPYDWR